MAVSAPSPSVIGAELRADVGNVGGHALAVQTVWSVGVSGVLEGVLPPPDRQTPGRPPALGPQRSNGGNIRPPLSVSQRDNAPGCINHGMNSRNTGGGGISSLCFYTFEHRLMSGCPIKMFPSDILSLLKCVSLIFLF